MKINLQEDQWDKFYESDIKRKKIMAALHTLKPEKTKECIDTLKTIMELNKDIIEISKINKEKTGTSLIDIKRNIKKTSFYQ